VDIAGAGWPVAVALLFGSVSVHVVKAMDVE